MSCGILGTSVLLIAVLAVYTNAQAPAPSPAPDTAAAAPPPVTTPPPPAPITTLPIVQALMPILPPAVKALLPSVTVDDAKKVINAISTIDISSIGAMIQSLTAMSPPVAEVIKAILIAAGPPPPSSSPPAGTPTA